MECDVINNVRPPFLPSPVIFGLDLRCRDTDHFEEGGPHDRESGLKYGSIPQAVNRVIACVRRWKVVQCARGILISRSRDT